MAPDPTPPGVRLRDDADARDWLRRHVTGEPRGFESVQSLWSGYGEIVRVHLDGGDDDSVIVKWVEPPDAVAHPRGWAGPASHARKLRSYDVERCFYSQWCAVPDPAFRTARCLAAERTARGFAFVLEDLDASGYGGRRRALNEAELRRCLGWLAAFHARFLGRAPDGLWEQGTYWHLATRRDELVAMKDPDLRAAAEPLDAALRGCRYRTIVHGDAKVANFCFSEGDVAAVDFQYVGGGCGVQDVAYFLSSCLDDGECEVSAPRLLDDYFGVLRARLGDDARADLVEAEWRGLYPAAWADFHRFLDGWAPDHWKIHAYTKRMTREALARI